VTVDEEKSSKETELIGSERKPESSAFSATSLTTQTQNEEAHLSDSVIRRVDGLKTFLSRDADSDIGRLDHRDVVGSVSDGEGHDAKVVLDEVDNLSFLERRDSAADDGVAAGGELEEEVFGPGFGEGLRRGRARGVGEGDRLVNEKEKELREG
jgi:hypothetical protein